jgi:EAL domain-containing protein (putative c-di-GMP-specific phosphodiesterase class I)
LAPCARVVSVVDVGKVAPTENRAELAPTRGTLYLAPLAEHTFDILVDYFRRAAIPFSEPHPEMLAVTLAPGRLRQLSQDFASLLSSGELQESRALVVAPGTVPTISELPRTQSLSALIGKVQGEWLVDLLLEDRLITHYQPILRCNLPDHVFAYESLLRGVDQDGALIPPNVIFSVAKSAELLSQLDRAARFAAIRGAVTHRLDSKLFINFIPTAIYDPAFSLSATVLEIEKSQIEPSRIVFEVVESEQVPDVDRLLRILDFYRDAGFTVALDDLGAGYSSLTLLTRLKPEFVKLDVELVRDVDRDPYKANIAHKLLELARSLGIQTIAEGVETRGEWEWLGEHECDFVQGFYFGRPAAPPELNRVGPPRGLASGTGPHPVIHHGARAPVAPSPIATPAPQLVAPSVASHAVAAASARLAAVPAPIQPAAPAPTPAPDEEVRRLREKVGELVMELDAVRRRLG